MPDITDIMRLLDREIWLVTAADQARRGGLIATFVCQASIVPAMPRMLVGIAKQHHTWQIIEASQFFTLHLLDEGHIDWVWRFGLQTGHVTDKFAELPVICRPSGAVHLSGIIAWLDCRVETSLDMGDRTIYVAKVVDGCVEKPAPPLRMKRLLELAPPERLNELREAMQRDSAIDAVAIQAWRQTTASRE